MEFGTMQQEVHRTWTIEIRPHTSATATVCNRCGPLPPPTVGAGTRRAALVHLAWHLRIDALAAHLRTCQCGEHGCRWHVRHRGCNGPVVLVLTRCDGGRLWRLADTCRACAIAIDRGAVVLEPESPDRAGRRLPHREPEAEDGSQAPSDQWWGGCWDVAE